jgi:hypothetical protein
LKNNLHQRRLPLAVATCGLLLGAVAMADPDPKPDPPVANGVRKIDHDHYSVGQVTFQKSTRAISFDAKVNQTGGLIEFLLVTEKGKIHESVFSTTISPTDLNVAFKLLGYRSSPELFEIRTADHQPTGRFPDVPEETRKPARIQLTVSWLQNGKNAVVDVNALALNSETRETIPAGPWLYTGSIMTESGFRAEATGDIVALFSNSSAMVNYPGKGRDNDEIWSVNPGQLPAKGSLVRITIQPFAEKPAKP